jgi:hypothetical protein
MKTPLILASFFPESKKLDSGLDSGVLPYFVRITRGKMTQIWIPESNFLDSGLDSGQTPYLLRLPQIITA